MSYVGSLVRAMVEADGDVVIFDSGVVPCVLARDHQVEVGSGAPSNDQIADSVASLLPPPQRDALERLGAVQYDLPPCPELPLEQLTLVVIQAEAIFLVEIRRHRQVPGHVIDAALAESKAVKATIDVPATPPAIPADVLPSRTETAPSRADEPSPFRWEEVASSRTETVSPVAVASAASTAGAVSATEEDSIAAELPADGSPDLSPHAGLFARAFQASAAALAGLFRRTPDYSSPVPPFADHPVSSVAADAAAGVDDSPISDDIWDETPAAPRAPNADIAATPGPLFSASSARPLGDFDGLSVPDADELWPSELPRVTVRAESAVADLDDTADFFGEPHEVRAFPTRVVSHQPPVPSRASTPPAAEMPAAIALPDEVIRLLQAGVARGATGLHLFTHAKPAIRVDGEMVFLDREQPLTTGQLEALLHDAIPENLQEAMDGGRRVECVSDVAGIGRVLWSTFLDRLGLAAIFRLPIPLAATADDLALSPEIQALALEPEGLILITGSRTSGKSAVISAIVDLVNRLRRDYVVTIETDIQVAHESQGSVISQREVRGGSRVLLAAAREALQDDPDVLAIEDVQGDALMRLMLKAAGAGHLVIGGLPARTATAAVESILDAHPAEHRQRAQAQLSEHLCGVVTQVMLRRPAGGSRIVREVLLNTPEVAKLIASGRTAQLPAAIAAGRNSGMVSLDDMLIDLVRSGEVDIHEAYRRTGDRAAFLDLLKGQGIDTSIFEPRH